MRPHFRKVSLKRAFWRSQKGARATLAGVEMRALLLALSACSLAHGAMDLEGQSCDSVWTDCRGCTSTGGFCGTPSGARGENGGHAAVVVCGEENCPDEEYEYGESNASRALRDAAARSAQHAARPVRPQTPPPMHKAGASPRATPS